MAKLLARIVIGTVVIAVFSVQAKDKFTKSSSIDSLAHLEQRVLDGGYLPVRLDFASWYKEALSADYLGRLKIKQLRAQIKNNKNGQP